MRIEVDAPTEVAFRRRAARRLIGRILAHAWLGLLCLVTAVALGRQPWWLMTLETLVGGGFLFLAGGYYERRQQLLLDAWGLESRATLEGMAASGMYTIADGFAALKDGPVPPGWRRRTYRRTQERNWQRLREEGNLPPSPEEPA